MNFIVQGYPAYAYTGGRPFDPKLPAIVFLHGAALDHSVWQWQARYFAHHGFSVLAVDLPGHGRSPGAIRPTIEALADWVAALIEASCEERAHVVGHSMGSLVALDTAIRHPRRVDRLALLGAAVPMAVGEAFLAAAKDDSAAAFDMQSVWGHARHVMLGASAVPGTTLYGASRHLVARARPGVQYADLAACNAYAPTPEALRGLKAATLVVAGRRDAMTPWKAGQALAREIPEATFTLLDAGHAMTAESPREVLQALRAHLPAGA
ncbi:MAG TPA: alpha/beta hydrolase [Usitatibacteraceae bacterium]|nr:alpha/beta hydrolase [Usitatibacteraceae bacterium]